MRAAYLERLSRESDISDHMPLLFATVCRYRGARVLELGVRAGFSTSALLAAAEEVGGHVWSVDKAVPQVPAWPRDRWDMIVSDDMAPELGALLPAAVDVLFIDTSHDYAHTLAELRRFVPLVAPGGTVLCHDTKLETMDGLAPQDPFPVARALGTFCAETGLGWVEHGGRYGMGRIDIPPRGGWRGGG